MTNPERSGPELLPCPFCGTTDLKFVGSERPYWYVRCNKCGAADGLCHTKDQAHESWNRRASQERSGPVAFIHPASLAQLHKNKVASVFFGSAVLDNDIPLYTAPPPSPELVEELRMWIVDLRAEAACAPNGYTFGQQAASNRAGRMADELTELLKRHAP